MDAESTEVTIVNGCPFFIAFGIEYVKIILDLSVFFISSLIFPEDMMACFNKTRLNPKYFLLILFRKQ